MGTTHLRLAATSTLLAGSGVLTIVAAAQRWWPACQLGGFDTAECLRLQDHRYDFAGPSAPWTPVGAAAELQGVATLLLAVAVLFLPGLLTGRRPRPPYILAAVLVSAGFAVDALATWLSGRAGELVTLPWPWPLGLLWVIAWPALLFGSAVADTSVPLRVWTGRWAVVVCLLASTTFITQLLLAPMFLGYSSYDTTPWSEVVTGALLITAAVFLGPATHSVAPPEAHSADATSVPQPAPRFAAS